jgi:serine/threonine protein kinase
VIEPGAVLQGRYHVTELLAQGGMADVFRARDGTLDRDVAVKAFRVGAGDVRRFHAETRLLAALDHRNLVRVFDAGDHHGQPYVVLELVAGPTLAHRLTDGPLSDGEARRLGADLAGALAYVHATNVVHRDVKPSNILLAPDGRALLGDFGIALLVDATRLTAAAETLGTAGYLAPEQVGGGTVTAAADVYALGLVLLEALTGVRAFIGTAQEVTMARLARPPSVPADLAGPWPELLSAMTALEPGVRPTAAAAEARLRGSGDAPAGIAAPAVIAAAPILDDPTEPAGSRGPRLPEPSEDATIVADRTQILEPLVSESPSGAAVARRTGSHLRWWLAGSAALLLVVLALVLLPGQADEPSVDPASNSTTTAVPTTTVSPSAPTGPPPATDDPVVSTCTQLEAAKQALDAEKQRIEQQYRDDKGTRQRLKKELEAEEQRINSQMKAARC